MPKDSILISGQQYTLTLTLEMPESDVNKHLGMFMTCVQLSSNDYKMVRSSCRSAMMKYRSEPVRSLERYFIWPALLTGYTDEKQFVHIPLSLPDICTLKLKSQVQTCLLDPSV